MRRVACLAAHSGPAWQCDFRSDGIVASCGADGLVQLWGGSAGPQASWRCVATAGKDAHTRAIRSVSWSPDGDFLAAGSFDSTATVWLVRRQRQQQQHRRQQQQQGPTEAAEAEAAPQVQIRLLQTLIGHENEVKGVAWNRDGTLLATCSRDKSIWVHRRIDSEADDSSLRPPSHKEEEQQQQDEEEQQQQAEEEEGEFVVAAVLTGHSQDVKAVRWHPRRDWLASASYDDTVAIWGLADDDWVMLKTLRGHSSTVWGLAFDPLGSFLFSSSADLTVRLWTCVPPGVGSAAGRQSRLSQWNVAPFLQPLEAAAARAAGAAAARAAAAAGESAAGAAAAAAAAGDSMYEETAALSQQQPEAWRCAAVIQGQHRGAVYAVSVHPKRELFATACGDGCIRIFSQTDTGAELLHCEEKAHESDVNSVAWSADDGEELRLASVGDDGYLRIWAFTALE
ncbi:hypothetical protein Efla_001254 [Eimeria flavescens]